MAARHLLQHQKQSRPLPGKQEKRVASPLPAHAPAAALLSKEHLHAYIHATITQHLPYYKALVKYQRRRNKTIRYTSGSHYKNLQMCYRITEKGLCLLKTRYAIKPKSPV